MILFPKWKDNYNAEPLAALYQQSVSRYVAYWLSCVIGSLPALESETKALVKWDFPLFEHEKLEISQLTNDNCISWRFLSPDQQTEFRQVSYQQSCEITGGWAVQSETQSLGTRGNTDLKFSFFQNRKEFPNSQCFLIVDKQSFCGWGLVKWPAFPIRSTMYCQADWTQTFKTPTIQPVCMLQLIVPWFLTLEIFSFCAGYQSSGSARILIVISFVWSFIAISHKPSQHSLWLYCQ